MNYTIENDFLSISVSDLGAELQSLASKATGTEYLWHGDPDVWSGRAPVLFPIVGRLVNNTYRLDGDVYELPQHGFARRQTFALSSKTETGIEFTLCDSEDTRRVYPFGFRLRVIHKLDKNSVATEFIVENPDTRDIYFSIGGHPGLACPFIKDDGSDFDDYYIEFEKEETASRMFLSGAHFLRETAVYLDKQRIMPLQKEMFAKDAITLTELKSDNLSLKSRRSNDYVTFTFTGFPLLAFWNKPGAPFVCVEPWFGHADFEDFDGDFRDKPGVISLAPGEVFKCGYSIGVFKD